MTDGPSQLSSITTGANSAPAKSGTGNLPSFANRRHDDKWFGCRSCRRATSFTVTPGTRAFGYYLTLVLIRPPTLAKGPNHDLHPAKLLHMVLYIASQIRLHYKTTLSNGLAD